MTTVRVPEADWLRFKKHLLSSERPDIVSAVPDEATAERVVTWDPPLSPAQESVVTDWLDAVSNGMSDAEWNLIKPELVALRSYHGLNSPTNAQTVAAMKAVIRTLRVVLRD